MNTEEQITELLCSLQDRAHINTFADMCAERAQGYAETTGKDEARWAAANAAYRATCSHACTWPTEAQFYANDASNWALDASCAADAHEDEIYAQLAHLKELHASEESSKKD